jgi:hypothetical protein
MKLYLAAFREQSQEFNAYFFTFLLYQLFRPPDKTKET